MFRFKLVNLLKNREKDLRLRLLVERSIELLLELELGRPLTIVSIYSIVVCEITIDSKR